MNTKNLSHLILLLFTVVLFSNCTKAATKTKTTEPTANTVQAMPVKKATQTTANIRKVDAKTFKAETEGKTVQLVDVRTIDEFKAGHIENAANVNIYDKNFMTQMEIYKKDEPVYVYCRSGGRSMKAARQLKSQGYEVINLNGGFMGWTRQEFKSVK